MLDAIVPRAKMRSALGQLLMMLRPQAARGSGKS
jgi:hypothetical protein